MEIRIFVIVCVYDVYICMYISTYVWEYVYMYVYAYMMYIYVGKSLCMGILKHNIYLCVYTYLCGDMCICI